jgi:hypothetical protein
MRTLVLSMVICFGCQSGTIGSPNPLDETVLRPGVDAITLDNDGDGFDNLWDNCANTAGDLEDRDDDGLGDQCDPHPDNPDYDTSGVLGGADAANDDFYSEVSDTPEYETETPDDDSEVEPEPESSVAVPMLRVCREREQDVPVLSAQNPIVEITNVELPSNRAISRNVSDSAEVFGSAPLVVSTPYPTLQVPVDRAKLVAELGELDDYAGFARFCDDLNANGGCDSDEPSLNAWRRRSDDLVSITMKIIDNHNEYDQEPECDTGVSSPLILDLAGDGISLSDYAVRFDLDANGTADLVSWLGGADDAFLALDIDGDGVIGSGAELFGNSTPLAGGTAANGFEALAAHDDNGDGAITAADSVFDLLLLWTDDNRDGRSQTDELARLRDRGVEAISVAYMSSFEVDAHGNQTRQRAVFWHRSGTGLIIDAWFKMLVQRP